MNSALFQNVLRELCDIQVVQFICGVQREEPQLWQVMLTIQSTILTVAVHCISFKKAFAFILLFIFVFIS